MFAITAQQQQQAAQQAAQVRGRSVKGQSGASLLFCAPTPLLSAAFAQRAPMSHLPSSAAAGVAPADSNAVPLAPNVASAVAGGGGGGKPRRRCGRLQEAGGGGRG